MASPPRAADRGRVTAAAVAAAFVLAVVGSAVAASFDRPGTAVFADTLSFAFVVAVIAVVGAVVTLAVPGNRVGWLPAVTTPAQLPSVPAVPHDPGPDRR